MTEKFCFACSSPVMDQAFFCFNCGIQIKCKSCQELLPQESNNCPQCGTAISGPKPAATNTIKLRESKDERVYEIEFTNEVGKEMREVVADLLKRKFGTETNYQYLPGGEKVSSGEDQYSFASFPVQENPSGKSEHENLGDRIGIGIGSTSYPHLNDLEMKLQCKENEWLLLFAFYLSDYGGKTFSKELVWQVYKDKRITETRFKNLGTNWKTLFKKYINTVKENEFKITSEGINKVNSLLLPTTENGKKKNVAYPVLGSSYSKQSTGRIMPVSRKTSAGNISPDEFDVYQNEYKESLEDYYKKKRPGNGNPNRIVTIAYYITKINHQDYFTEGHIDYAYRILKLAGKPVHLKQIIINLKNDRMWFQKSLDPRVGGWKLTRQAEIYVEEKLPSPA